MNTFARIVSSALLVVPALSFAQLPARAEGLVVRLEPLYTVWSLDAGNIQQQTSLPAGDAQTMLVDQTPNAPGLAFVLGYNIAGHATIAASITATGWDLTTEGRGGGGFAGLELSWHPLELVPQLRQRKYDASLFGGAGYFVVGEHRALDGLNLQAGLRAEYFVNNWLSLGGSLRYVSLRGSRYVTDWDREEYAPLPSGSGGSALLPALTIGIHAPLR